MSIEVDRRKFLKFGGAAFGFQALGLGTLLAACGSDDEADSNTPTPTGTGTGTATSGATTAPVGGQTLTLPFGADMQIPDPDIMYEGEGCYVMHSVYEGLIDYDYASEAGAFRPQLAESWEVSEDLLTYTFLLRPGVLFHDGTPADAESWIKSFERRLAVNQGPAYMVAGVIEMTAPDPTTFIVTLSEPNNAFLHYLACPWRPFAVSPTAVAANEVNGDLAQEWLKTHDAGTGPYTITEFTPGTGYKLNYVESWWGETPDFTTINITIVPDFSTQRLLLESGEADLTKSIGFRDALSFQENPDFETYILKATSFITLWLNPTSGMLGSNRDLRRAIIQAIDVKSILDPTFDGTVEVTTDFISPAVIPTGVTPFHQDYDPTVLAGMVDSLESKSIDLAYRESGGPPYRQIAELIQTQLATFGLDVTVRGMPSSQMFAMNTGPEDQFPDLMITTWGGGGDALHFDTGARIQLRTGAKPLNWFNYSNAEVDAEMDLAILEPTVELTNAHYTKISEIVQEDAMVFPLGRDV
ncbi:MAG TPA: ABC transporter substrate-binding protein, partial [Ilumatobacter sp.]|nr:ABC transporter substrate-binding protein [Ilumatobacter sp.]